MVRAEDKQLMTERLERRLEQLEARVIAEFHKWSVSAVSDGEIQKQRSRNFDLELEAMKRRAPSRAR